MLIFEKDIIEDSNLKRYTTIYHIQDRDMK